MPFSFKPSQEVTGPQLTQESAPISGAEKVETPPPSSFFSFTSRLPKKIGIFQLVLYIVFSLLILFTILLFGYQWYLKSQVGNKKDALMEYDSKLGTIPLEEMRALSNRLKFINQLVKTHPSVDVAFRIIEDSVENPVTYTRFDLAYDDGKKIYVLQLGANAPDYRSVVQQMDTFKNKPYNTYISNVAIDGLHPDDTGKVTFSLKMPIAIVGLLPEEVIFSEKTLEVISVATSGVIGTSTSTTQLKTGQSSNETSTTTFVNGTTTKSQVNLPGVLPPVPNKTSQ